MMAVADTTVSTLMSTLADSLTSATTSLPSDHDLVQPPTDGISLLDTKNALLLSYIHNLVFLIILKLRQTAGEGQDAIMPLDAAVIKKLVELRVYMERGVRPLEGRLKYQIEKALRAADDAERAAATKTDGGARSSNTTKVNGVNQDDSDASDADASDADTGASPQPAKPSDLSYRPNPAALLRKREPSSNTKTSNPRLSATYKPPRITPTSMPTSNTSSRDTNLSRRQRKSHLLDEYVSSELSLAPLAEPSIGSNSTILARGRGSLNARQREKERERTEYEERNLARLPGETRAEKRKARMRGEGGARNVYGGEQWVELGEVGDRVARSVGKRRDGGRGVLERREKRRRDDGDERGGGVSIGETFEKRRRVMEGRAEKKARKGR
jgi:U3 small nucleolar ribonucleoprotein protein LCP5